MKADFDNAKKAYDDFMRLTYTKTENELLDLQDKKRKVEDAENRAALRTSMEADLAAA